MFLEAVVRRSPGLAAAAIELHRSGDVPPNTYVIDVDGVRDNARAIARSAGRLGVSVFAMTKQFGRNPVVMDAIREGGVDTFAAVDVRCATVLDEHGHAVGNVGHLVQVPHSLAGAVAAMRPRYWTVFGAERAAEAAGAAARLGRQQQLLIGIGGTTTTQAASVGGIATSRLSDLLAQLPSGGVMAGVTAFPVYRFDRASIGVRPTPLLGALQSAAAELHRLGLRTVEVNVPGETSAGEVMERQVADGATQVEPGHAFTGSTPLHAFLDLQERPAMVYVTEVSHWAGSRAAFFGGGLYVCQGNVADTTFALVGSSPDAALANRLEVDLPPVGTVDFYGHLRDAVRSGVQVGDSVVLAFRAQVFVTRAHVAPVVGIREGLPRLCGLWSSSGERILDGERRVR